MTSLVRSRRAFHLGMQHTISGGLSEVALLALLADIQWSEMGRLTGCPPSRQVDADGRSVYASIFFVDIDGFPADGLRAFRPDDDIEIVSGLGRFGLTMLEGEHALFPAETLAAALPETLPTGPRVRLSSVLIALGVGAEDLRISTPANAPLDGIPLLPTRPDSYRLIREAQAAGIFFATPAVARRLWPGAHTVTVAINPDRDLNGVGLLYFANYITFMDVGERAALAGPGEVAASALDGRATVRRRIGFFGNARPSDAVIVEVEGFALETGALLLHHRVRRQSDGRLIAVASAEKRLRTD